MLGDTIEQIAWQKAGIIKPHGHVFTSAAQDPIALEIIRQVGRRHGDTTWWYDRVVQHGGTKSPGRYTLLQLIQLQHIQFPQRIYTIELPSIRVSL